MTGRLEKNLLRLGVIKGSRVGIAVSGGIDSMALLNCMYLLQERIGMTLTAYHFEHGIRGKVSKEDMEHVVRECKKLGVPCVTGSADVLRLAGEKGVSTETAARESRYEFLDAQNEDFIATAHHLNDNAETVLFNLVRGSGLKGLCGIPEKRGRYIRPFLDISRREIEEYVKENGIRYVEDYTNEDSAYSRNFIRKEIIPRLECLNAAVSENISRAAKLLSEDEEALESAALQSGCIQPAKCGTYIKLDILRQQKEAVKKRIIRLAAHSAGELRDIENVHVDAILGLAERGESGKSVSLGHGLTAVVVYGRLMIFRPAKKEYNISPAALREGRFEFANFLFDCAEYRGAPAFCGDAEYFDREAVCGAEFRFRLRGDYIRPLGMSGKKRLSDYLSDRKVPLHERDSLVLLARGNEILWVVGTGVSESSKVRNDKRIYKISCKEIGDG